MSLQGLFQGYLRTVSESRPIYETQREHAVYNMRSSTDFQKMSAVLGKDQVVSSEVRVFATCMEILAAKRRFIPEITKEAKCILLLERQLSAIHNVGLQRNAAS
jgi:hypothetical protein